MPLEQNYTLLQMVLLVRCWKTSWWRGKSLQVLWGEMIATKTVELSDYYKIPLKPFRNIMRK